MNQKGFVNILLIVIVVVLVGAGIYVALIRQISLPVPTLTPTSSPSPTPTPTPTPKPNPTSKPSPTLTPTPKPSSTSYREDGTCPPGYVSYGIPLDCITPEYMEYCRTNPCPVCLAGSTLIDTPSGSAPVKDLQKGMPVWTTDQAGNRIAGVVVKTSRVPVLSSHQMVQLALDDGRELYVSPGHPTVDGRVVENLAVNDLYDGARVLSVDRVAPDEGFTYDILPSGETGFYWANGILLDSTLH